MKLRLWSTSLLRLLLLLEHHHQRLVIIYVLNWLAQMWRVLLFCVGHGIVLFNYSAWSGLLRSGCPCGTEKKLLGKVWLDHAWRGPFKDTRIRCHDNLLLSLKLLRFIASAIWWDNCAILRADFPLNLFHNTVLSIFVCDEVSSFVRKVVKI